MKNYRLKKEAVKFFKEGLSTSVRSLDAWKDLQVDIEALEEVEDVRITYGHSSTLSSGNESNSLNGWSPKDGAEFHFTIQFPSMKHRDYDQFNKGRNVRELMNRIQTEINRFQSQFLEEN